jgi:transposase
MTPNDLPPWEAGYEQTQRWLSAGVFEAIGDDLRMLWRLAEGRIPRRSFSIVGPCNPAPKVAPVGSDGAKRQRGSKGHMDVDTLGHLLALHVNPANEQDRAQVAQLAEQEQDVTDASAEGASVDQVDIAGRARQDAADHGMQLKVVKRPQAKKGFVRLPRRWVVERRFGWAARFRRLAQGYERLPGTLAGWHVLAFTILMLTRFVVLMVQRPNTL